MSLDLLYETPYFFFVSLASSSSFFLAPKVGMPISLSSSSVRVAKVWRSTSCRRKTSVYLPRFWLVRRLANSSRPGATSPDVITLDEKWKG